MIRNSPDAFPVSRLFSFDFGDADARDDRMLAMCPVPTASMDDFLSDRRDIVLGFRAAGKSALVRLLVEKKLSFKQNDGWKPLLVCLDEELDYRTIREHLRKHGQDDPSSKMMCRVVWEILIIYGALQSVQEHINDSDSTIREFINDIKVLLGVSARKPRLVEILLSHKKKVGVRFDSNLPNIVDMYAGLEPSLAVEATNENAILKLVDYKKYINKFLFERKLTLYILFDRLDDFMVQEDYKTQKLLLQSLLATQVDYRQKYQNVKIKSFLRTDLFQKLDLSDFGPDKILSRCVELTWTPSEIKHFVAKRVAFNLLRAHLTHLELYIDKDQFHVRRDDLPKLYDAKLALSDFDILKISHWQRLWWYLGIAKRRNRGSDGRLQNSSDIVSETVIYVHISTKYYSQEVGRGGGINQPVRLF